MAAPEEGTIISRHRQRSVSIRRQDIGRRLHRPHTLTQLQTAKVLLNPIQQASNALIFLGKLTAYTTAGSFSLIPAMLLPLCIHLSFRMHL